SAWWTNHRRTWSRGDVLDFITTQRTGGGSGGSLRPIQADARDRAGLEHATGHELRHTCLTRLREAGMALEAVRAQAGHASIEPTRRDC
ncbi:MAG: tyrosine-type recombinase/integrase, partial [Actinobacteria bacterium]|nr:tyrosine-type recombinase/integrase [Actinomycetota bacterium]